MGELSCMEVLFQEEGPQRDTTHFKRANKCLLILKTAPKLPFPVTALNERQEINVIEGKELSPGGSVVKNLPAMQETWVLSLGRKDSLEKKTATHSSILAGKSMDRGMVGYRLWGHEESDTT